jgi:hypothetical protein
LAGEFRQRLTSEGVPEATGAVHRTMAELVRLLRETIAEPVVDAP